MRTVRPFLLILLCSIVAFLNTGGCGGAGNNSTTGPTGPEEGGELPERVHFGFYIDEFSIVVVGVELVLNNIILERIQQQEGVLLGDGSSIQITRLIECLGVSSVDNLVGDFIIDQGFPAQNCEEVQSANTFNVGDRTPSFHNFAGPAIAPGFNNAIGIIIFGIDNFGNEHCLSVETEINTTLNRIKSRDSFKTINFFYNDDFSFDDLFLEPTISRLCNNPELIPDV